MHDRVGLPCGALESDADRIRFLTRLCWRVLDRKGRTMLVGGVVLVVILSYATSLAPILFARFIDAFSARRSLYFATLALLSGFLLVHLAANLGREALWIIVGPVQQRIQRKANVFFFEHALFLLFQYHIEKSTGEFQEKLTQAQNGMNQIIFTMLTSFMPTIAQTIFILFNSILLLPYFISIIMIFTIILYVLVLFYSLDKLRSHQRNAQGHLIKAQGVLADALSNIETVKAFVQESGVTSRYDERLTSAEKQFRTFLTARFLLGAAQSFILVFGLSIALFYGVSQVRNMELTIGSLVLIEMYFIQVIGPLQGLSRNYREIKSGLVMLDGVAGVLMLKPEADPGRGRRGGAHSPRPPTHPGRALRFDERLTFDTVTVASDGRTILDAVSLTFEPGRSTALVGPTGAGKSSIVRLILKLIEPTCGAIRLGDAPLCETPPLVWRRHVSLVPQEAVLFNDTLANNLLFAQPKASREDLAAVIRRAKLDDLVRRSRDGLETIVGERGQMISGGERQRIGLARALLRNSKIIIFDEATSALDRNTEEEIWNDLRRFDATAMKIIVTHRLQNIVHCDSIYVLDRGKLSQHGTHNDLIQQKGLYRSLWRQSRTHDENIS